MARALMGARPRAVIRVASWAVIAFALLLTGCSSSSESAPVSRPLAIHWTSLTSSLAVVGPNVSCVSMSLCVFAGDDPSATNQSSIGVSTGPFAAGSTVTGAVAVLPGGTQSAYVDCPSAQLCVASDAGALYATSQPVGGSWRTVYTPTKADALGTVSCPTATFCAAIDGYGSVVISNDPLGGPSTWTSTSIGTPAEQGLLSISCPTASFCVAIGSTMNQKAGLMAVSSDPEGGSGAWKVTTLTYKPGGPAIGQDISLSCPTTSFCFNPMTPTTAAITTNPSGGVSSWRVITGTGLGSGAISCTVAGSCRVSGAGAFSTASSAKGPRIAGFPQGGVSCVSASFCIRAPETVPGALDLAVGSMG